MLYVSSYSGLKGPETPCAVFFDDLLDDIGDIAENLNFVRYARTSTGYGNQLNPIRGQTDDQYFLTSLKQGRTGTDLYADHSIADHLTAYGPIGSFTSGNYPYDMITTIYLDPGKYRRQIFLNPFTEDNYLFASDTAMYGGRVVSFSQNYFAYDGSDLKKVSYQYPGGISGYDNRFYAELLPDRLYVDAPVSFSSIVHRDGGRPIGTGRMSYKGNIVPEVESVNLTFAVAVIEHNIYMLRSGIEYQVDANLIPGTRPEITFNQTHTLL